MNKQELLKCLKEALTHLSEVEKHTELHNEIIKKLYLQVPPELSEDKEIGSLLKELDNRNEEVAISWSMYLFKG
nr:restriction endonuclease subunit S [uncultured Capnocytophaga sp.]